MLSRLRDVIPWIGETDSTTGTDEHATAVEADGSGQVAGTVEPPETGETGRDEQGATGRADGETSDGPVASFPKNFYQILHRTKAPFFVLDAEGNAVVWNEGIRELTGSAESEARAAEQVSQVWYHDGRRSMTLADKVIDTHGDPDTDAMTHEAYDVEKIDRVDFTLYEDSSTFTDADGETRHIRFSATPLYDDGEFVGVAEYVEDRTEEVRHRHELEDLVEELVRSMGELEAGNLDARASFTDPDHIEDEFLAVVDAFNDMSERLQRIVDEIGAQTGELRASAEEIAETTDSITDTAHDQQESLAQVSSEVNEMSATVEEVASITSDVAANAEQSVELAEAGSQSADEAKQAMTEVAAAGEAVMDDVETLQERVVEIDNIVEVINDIAEQTNILALNASIEAARAGQEGEGFAVVANEVKSLAEESQQQATEIESMVEAIQTDTEETVDSLREMNDRVDEGATEVQAAMDNLGEITAGIEETADGITEVSDATDDQAASAEEIASMIDDVVETADEVAADVDDIAERNTDHTARADEIERTLERLTDS